MAQAAASSVNKEMELSMERLSTGKRINSASDDAAGVAIASRLTSEIKGINQAIRNAADGQAMIDTAEGAHIEVSNMLQRMRELSVQSANDTNNETDRANLQLELDQLMTEVNRVAEATTWAGIGLLNGTAIGLASSHADTQSYNFQIGTRAVASDQIKVQIGAVTSAALGLGNPDGSAEAISAAGPRTEGPAVMTVADGTVSVEGALENNDVFTFDMNGHEISITYSIADQYTNDLAGLGAQIKQAIDAEVVAGTDGFVGVTAVDNGDGSVSVTQSAVPVLSAASFTTDTGGANTITTSGNMITMSGTFTTADAVTVDVNGVTVTASFVNTATEGYADSLAGMGATLADKIRDSAGLAEMNLTVTDLGNGSITIEQATQPSIQGRTMSPVDTDSTLTYTTSTELFTFGGEYVEGKRYDADVFGTTISITAGADDGFTNDLAGLSEQFAKAVNDAGITGVTAAKTANANTVSLTFTPVVDTTGVGLEYDPGDDSTLTYTAASTKFTIGSTVDAGDKYKFNVNGTDFLLTVATDGYLDTDDGVGQQMADMINAAGIDGVTAYGNFSDAGTTAAAGTVFINFDGKTVTQLNNTSTDLAVSNITVMDSAYFAAEESSSDAASISISTTSEALQAIAKIDAALSTINSQRAQLGSYSNRLDSTISNLTNISTNLQAGRGRIEDADFAAETTSLAKSQILQQASTAMLAQANASKQNVLSLLQG
jgi:flagellin